MKLRHYDDLSTREQRETDEYGTVTFHADVYQIFPRLPLWDYFPSYIDEDPIHPDKDQVERPPEYHGHDCMKITLHLVTEDGVQESRDVSISRGIRRGRDGEPTYNSSAFISDMDPRPYEYDHFYENISVVDGLNLWEYSTPEFPHWDELMETLFDFAEGIYSDRGVTTNQRL